MYKTLESTVLIIIVAIIATNSLRANNIQISDVKSLDELRGDGYNSVTFTVSWDHSWRMVSFGNWDGAWIIGKAYTRSTGTWKHIRWHPDTLQHTVDGHGDNMTIRIAEGGVGALLYRATPGVGSIQADMKMWWYYNAAGFSPTDTVIVSIFAIEVVYIPSGEFMPGDGKSNRTLYCIGRDIKEGTGHFNNAEKINAATGYSYNGNAIPPEYPTGYDAFYIMKHEISQHAYVDFLNTLTYKQQAPHTSVSIESAEGSFALITAAYNTNFKQYRNYIRVRVSGNLSLIPDAQPAVYGNSVLGIDSWSREDNAGNVACNFLLWSDLLAYADWSGMRPFTELEFEKACRGPKIYSYADYAWGQAYVEYITKNAGKWFIHEDSINELAATKISAIAFLNDGPNAIETGKEPWVMRVGAFAKDSSWRGQSGATYWGVMNMSDNVWERCVNVHTPEGRSFVASNGNGEIGEKGPNNVPGWAGINLPAATILRGFQTSNRQSLGFQAKSFNEDRHPAVGGRLAITITPALAD
ncbi:MAG: formylglycine-generating enzyme family protein [Bacteroidales bacterium]|jgi:formylglycine-generating enzyme required for sulfatase activity|nr:formylglycine-generating enzyme family protein [Bacteroidales bacterium]